MHTLTRNQYDDIRATMRNYIKARPKGGKGWHHLLYLVLIDKSTRKIMNAFPKVTSPRHLHSLKCQGKAADHALWEALTQADFQLQNLKYYRSQKQQNKIPAYLEGRDLSAITLDCVIYDNHGVATRNRDFKFTLSDEAIEKAQAKIQGLREMAKS